MKNLAILFIALLLIQLTGCKNESKSVVNKDNDSIHYNKTVIDTTIDVLSNVPIDFQIQYKIIKIEDLSYSGVDRRRGKISVPSGLSKKELIQNIYHSIREIYNEYNSDGISIWIYVRENDGQIGNYLGSAEFAPYGDWGKVDSNLPLEEYLVRLDIQQWYYKSEGKTKTNSTKIEKENDIKIPEYKILDRVQMISGDIYYDILIESFSRKTSNLVIERVLKAISKELSANIISLYCSREALKSMFSSSYSELHPEAIECYIGEYKYGKFRKG